MEPSWTRRWARNLSRWRLGSEHNGTLSRRRMRRLTLSVEAMGAEQVDEIWRRKIYEYVLEVQEDSEEEGAAWKIPLPRVRHQRREGEWSSTDLDGRTSLAETRLSSRTPRSMPLYWKWMESMKRRPGCRNRDAAMTRVTLSDERTYLWVQRSASGSALGASAACRRSGCSPVQRKGEHSFRGDDRCPLECHDRPVVYWLAAETGDLGVDEVGDA